MFANPYVGITGFMSEKEVITCLEAIPDNASHQLMVGVLASSKTLSGQMNSKPERYPAREKIYSIFVDSEKAFNCLHFFTDKLENLYDEIMKALEYGGPKLNGIQLNLVWPDPNALSKVKLQYPELRITLQVSPNLAGYLIMNEWQIANDIRRNYSGLIDYVLIDFGRGEGGFVNLKKSNRLLSNIQSINLGLGLVLAGGLMAENLVALEMLFEDFSDLSIDAESRLRTMSAKGGSLILTDAVNYLKTFFTLTK